MSALFPRRRPGSHLPPGAYRGTPAAPLSSAAGLFEPATPVQPSAEVNTPRHVTPEPGPPTLVIPVVMLEELRWPEADQDPPSALRTAGDVAFRNRILANLHQIWR